MKNTIWNDVDLFKAAIAGSVVGLVVGIVVGYEWAWQPVVHSLKPLIG